MAKSTPHSISVAFRRESYPIRLVVAS